jgi:sugar lactone lactonase YvrE
LYDPSSRRAFLFSARTEDATAVDGVRRKVTGTIPLGGKPEAATSDEKGHLFVNIEDKDLVLELDAKKLTVMESWPVAPCREPASMAIDARNQRIFVGCRNQLMVVMNTNNGQVITKLPIGELTDAAVFDPQGSLIFSSNGDGTLTVIQEESPTRYTVVDNVKTEFGARTMAIDLKTHRLFLSLADRRNIPAPGTLNQNLRPEIIPGTFKVLVVGKN